MAERNEKGHFQPGHSVKSPGRPPRAVEAEYLTALTEICTLARWKKIVLKAVQDAEKGNGYARQWLAEYIIGKPVQTIDLRASEQALLTEVLALLKAQGITPADIFAGMKAELMAGEEVIHEWND